MAQEMKPSVQEAIDEDRYEDAITLLQREIASDPGYHLNYYLLGTVYYELDQYSAAAEQFQMALKKKNKHYKSLYYLALSYVELDRLDEATTLIAKGLKKAKDLKAQFENVSGLISLKKEDYQDADRAFRRALAENEASLNKRIKDLKNAPHPEEEKQQLIEQMRSKSLRENARFRINLGDANFYSGVPALAVLEYEKALQVDTGSLEVYYHWSEACLKMKDFGCALEKLNIVLGKDSTHAPSWMRAGEIYFKAARATRTRAERTTRFKDAIGAYQRYLELSAVQPDSSSVRVFFELAMSYQELYGFEQAAEFFEMVLSIPYEIKNIYFNYGKALWGIKNYEKASHYLEKHIDWVAQQNENYKSSVKDWELMQLLGDSYFYRKPRDYYTAIKYYTRSLEHRPEQKRLVQNVAIGYHTMKSYVEALEYYDKRIELGIDSSGAGIVRNAGFAALNIASGGEEDFELDDEEDMMLDGSKSAGGMAAPDPDINYFVLAIGYLEQYLEFNPTDLKVLTQIANSYLYQLEDCANGVASFERILAVDENNCAALKSIGFAYFGGDLCNQNYGKSIRYLLKAYECLRGGDGVCSDVDIPLWVAQAYHLRAAEPGADKNKSNSDFKNAYEWYGRVLKCEPAHVDAKKGQNDTRFEFN